MTDDTDRKAERSRLLWVLYHRLSERQQSLVREAKLVAAAERLLIEGQGLEGYRGHNGDTYCLFCLAHLTHEEATTYSLVYEHDPDCLLIELLEVLEDYGDDCGPSLYERCIRGIGPMVFGQGDAGDRNGTT
jgi:hypothetical protein